MPHCGYADTDVEAVYQQLSDVIKLERKRGHLVIVGGDWNAEVASASDAAAQGSVGQYGNPVGNARGA
eukprot:2293132-Karenia_brevis.AAC.1